MDQTKAEWSGFKNLIFQKRQSHYQAIDPKISAVKMSETEGKKSVQQLKKELNSFAPKMLWESFSNDPVKDTYPNMMYLSYLLYAACVERLFSKMKQSKNKTCLRSKL